MINTLELANQLKNVGNMLLTVKIQGDASEKEYVIDSVTREKSYFDDDHIMHICLNVRDGGDGCIKR